jgi:hypothetical protein
MEAYLTPGLEHPAADRETLAEICVVDEQANRVTVEQRLGMRARCVCAGVVDEQNLVALATPFEVVADVDNRSGNGKLLVEERYDD